MCGRYTWAWPGRGTATATAMDWVSFPHNPIPNLCAAFLTLNAIVFESGIFGRSIGLEEVIRAVSQS